MKLKFIFKEKTQSELKIGKLNIFYGSSNSGKSMLLKELSESFSGKGTSNFSINNCTVSKTEFDVLFFDISNTFNEQLKQAANKSLLKKIIYEQIISASEKELSTEKKLVESINESLDELSEQVNSVFSFMNDIMQNCKINLKLNVESIEELLPVIISFIIDENEKNIFSHSNSKQLLFALIFYYIKINAQQKVIIIDNFDAELDEELIICYLNQMKKMIAHSNCYFILSSNRTESLLHSFGNAKIFCLKNDKIKDLSNIELFLKKSILENPEEKINSTFEEFLLNTHMFVADEQLQAIKSQIKTSIPYNLGKMLVNKDYVISDQIIENKISIVPNSKIERLFLQEIDRYLNQ
ncbi:MAG: hypothetical protein FWE36_04520 [Erysipelotrichales bacterium]|nr:hypothetical protein [Erysipelotrichales bacterium]